MTKLHKPKKGDKFGIKVSLSVEHGVVTGVKDDLVTYINKEFGLPGFFLIGSIYHANIKWQKKR